MPALLAPIVRARLQVYCSGDGTYRVFAFTTTETAFSNDESPHVAVTTKQLVAQVKRRPIISNTGN